MVNYGLVSVVADEEVPEIIVFGWVVCDMRYLIATRGSLD